MKILLGVKIGPNFFRSIQILGPRQSCIYGENASYFLRLRKIPAFRTEKEYKLLKYLGFSAGMGLAIEIGIKSKRRSKVKEDIRNLEHQEANARKVRPCQVRPSNLPVISPFLPRKTLRAFPCGQVSFPSCQFIAWWAKEIWQVNPRNR